MREMIFGNQMYCTGGWIFLRSMMSVPNLAETYGEEHQTAPEIQGTYLGSKQLPRTISMTLYPWNSPAICYNSFEFFLFVFFFQLHHSLEHRYLAYWTTNVFCSLGPILHLKLLKILGLFGYAIQTHTYINAYMLW